ncbi:MAG: hypothetical protein NZ924_02825 [Candidatus Bipolaricaulota bacterium]|nr:hypothetical protein [Candidatus Bipolaricaulota bacterium]MDW8151840.1 hypothetical protein [Candidatus Bipolaricaulota bacterium]
MGADGWVWQTFMAQGALEPIVTDWIFLFGPSAPAFLYAYGRYVLQISGLGFTVHTAMVGASVAGGPSGGTVIECKTTLSDFAIAGELGLGAYKENFTLTYTGVSTHEKVLPLNPFPGGLEFRYLELSAEAVPLCCGICLDLGFSFVKEGGFDRLTATLKGIPLCSGLTLDAEVELTTTVKTVRLKPSWAEIKGCLTVYGDIRFTDHSWQGIELYGAKIRCDLGDHAYAEFLTAFDVRKLEELLKDAEIFQGAEFEYVKFGFSGLGCCGGKWALAIGLYFQPAGSLFGLSRVLLDACIFLLENFAADLKLSFGSMSSASLTLGWTITL